MPAFTGTAPNFSVGYAFANAALNASRDEGRALRSPKSCQPMAMSLVFGGIVALSHSMWMPQIVDTSVISGPLTAMPQSVGDGESDNLAHQHADMGASPGAKNQEFGT